MALDNYQMAELDNRIANFGEYCLDELPTLALERIIGMNPYEGIEDDIDDYLGLNCPKEEKW